MLDIVEHIDICNALEELFARHAVREIYITILKDKDKVEFVHEYYPNHYDIKLGNKSYALRLKPND